MRLLIDMNLSPRWVDFLRDEGFEADHWSHVGDPRASDATLMAFAASAGAVILTHDLDFGTMLAAIGGSAPSVVQLRADDLNLEAIGGRVVTALREAEAALASGALITIDPARARISLLPIGNHG